MRKTDNRTNTQPKYYGDVQTLTQFAVEVVSDFIGIWHGFDLEREREKESGSAYKKKKN